MRRDVFQAIADPTRRQIINMIAHKNLNIDAVAEKFDVSRPAISKQRQNDAAFLRPIWWKRFSIDSWADFKKLIERPNLLNSAELLQIKMSQKYIDV